MPKFLFWALLLKTALVYFQQEQFLIAEKEMKSAQFQLNIISYSLTIALEVSFVVQLRSLHSVA
ncbi:MAG: hypothetical protein HWQ35_10220 [Nostoc sp. NMS1]|uniref:hypothetical protein n=1 Tax=unclassified Nostoc TaxID=2593658 RepID=UPI0025E74B69|nr:MULTISPECIES: hypothetical protein [unclassified Nostoc]MBN3906908.1 hypothetical protein [Nostoc sp. NMS1]MBN3993951.1 hypothetical protein [Nostoc sp. NMS2]